MNTESEHTVDIETSIAKAYDSTLSAKEQEHVRKHLSFILPKLKEPNKLIEPVRAALVVMGSRPVRKPLYARVGAIGWTLISGLIIAGITKALGWN